MKFNHTASPERLGCLDSSPDHKRRFGFWLRAWLPVLACIGIIALESTAFFGADSTSGPLRWLYEHLFGPVGEPRWLQIHHYIRKSGHFLGYGMIGLAWLRAWWMILPRSTFLLDAFLAVLGTGLIASIDEFHQTFLPNRTGLSTDVLLDCCGAIILQLVVYIIVRALHPNRLIRPA